MDEQTTGAMDVRNRRRDLPVFGARNRLLREISRHDTVVVLGETGSGKTTQIPQYLLESGLHRKGAIAVTQPRRVAAVAVASRVASERNSPIGTLVGYCVRFEDVSCAKTKIRFATDGMLLREASSDRLLRRYGIVILDEVHERTLHTDILLGIVKDAQVKRADSEFPLKVIVMSATMDVDSFSKYFNNCPVLYVEGRQFPVQIMYAKEPQPDYVFSTIVSIFQVHQEMPPGGDILVFLTGQEEIESVTKSIKDIATLLPHGSIPILVHPLYASLPAALQLRIFSPTPKGFRKIIISTNVAETSITISGVQYVIDAGFAKLRMYSHGNCLESLKVQRISKAQAWQRSGRAGRECSGTCYRLYTEAEFSALQELTVPEIKRCSLASAILQMLVLGIVKPLEFDFLEAPTTEAIEDALHLLELLGAAVSKQGQIQLTKEGEQMAKFPVDPKMSKIILASEMQGCTEEILSIVSMLSVETIAYTPSNKREEAAARKRKFVSSEGDIVTLLNIFHAYKAVNGNKQWCKENFIHTRNMKMVLEIRKQLADICDRCNIKLKSCNRNYSLVRKCLVAGLFMNTAELQPSKEYKTLSSKHKVFIHPGSCLFGSHPAHVVYCDLVHTSKIYMRNVCLIDPKWLVEMSPRKITNSES